MNENDRYIVAKLDAALTGKPAPANPEGRYSKKSTMVKAGAKLSIAEGMPIRESLEAEVREGINDGMRASIRIGKALLELQTKRYYMYTHTDWEVYSREVLGISPTTSRRLMHEWGGASAVEQSVNTGGVSATLAETLTDREALQELGKARQEDRTKILDLLRSAEEPPSKEAIRAAAKMLKPPAPEPRVPPKIVDKKRRKIGRRVLHCLREARRGLDEAGLLGPFGATLKALTNSIEEAFNV